MATVATGSALEKGMAYIADSKRSATVEMWTMKGIGTLYPYNLTKQMWRTTRFGTMDDGRKY